MKARNFVNHFKTVCKHKYWVLVFCVKAGIPIQGIMHDLSKFSPSEFLESVKYYQGNRSPIDACKEENGYSGAWMHHKGRNKHHYEYWQDNFDGGGEPIQIPFKYALEMVCDYLGAGKAYHGKNFTPDKELDWWNGKKSKPLAMHPQTKIFVDLMMNKMANDGNYDSLNYQYARSIYKKAMLCAIKSGLCK